MITKQHISQHTFAKVKSASRNEKYSENSSVYIRSSQKARELMKSMMNDFPEDDQVFTHNFD